jgi:hypothetical protein
MPDIDHQVQRQLDGLAGHVPLSRPGPTRAEPPPFPARALRYGPGEAPLLEPDYPQKP